MAAPPAVSQAEMRKLRALAAEPRVECENARALVCRDGELLAEFEYANEAHEFVRRLHDTRYRIFNPNAVAA